MCPPTEDSLRIVSDYPVAEKDLRKFVQKRRRLNANKRSASLFSSINEFSLLDIRARTRSAVGIFAGEGSKLVKVYGNFASKNRLPPASRYLTSPSGAC